MRFILFLNRVAIVCNVCFLISFVLKLKTGVENYQNIVAPIAILGLIVSFILNAIILITAIIAFVIGKKKNIPTTLFLINMVIYLLQFYYLIVLQHNG